ncbi:hypothetical protein KL939_004608 [Ogataea angusta]|nr:hypothetical protein KL939_004608 [Ogataea angusta]
MSAGNQLSISRPMYYIAHSALQYPGTEIKCLPRLEQPTRKRHTNSAICTGCRFQSIHHMVNSLIRLQNNYQHLWHDTRSQIWFQPFSALWKRQLPSRQSYYN